MFFGLVVIVHLVGGDKCIRSNVMFALEIFKIFLTKWVYIPFTLSLETKLDKTAEDLFAEFHLSSKST